MFLEKIEMTKLTNFIVSSISKRMENGDPTCILGKSGIEIVMDIIE